MGGVSSANVTLTGTVGGSTVAQTITVAGGAGGAAKAGVQRGRPPLPMFTA